MINFLCVVTIAACLASAFKVDAAVPPNADPQVLIRQYEEEIQCYASRVDQAERAPHRSTVPASKPDVKVTARAILDLIRTRSRSAEQMNSLSWIVLNCPQGKEMDATVDLLVSDYAVDASIGRVCEVLLKTGPASDRLLRAVEARHPIGSTRGIACIVLARKLKKRAATIRLLKSDADLRAGWLETMGKEHVESYLRIDPEEAVRESEVLFARAFERYGLRDPVEGDPAPEISGVDIDGRPMKLSDFRGKVVLLSFWGAWCGPCMALVPEERKLVEHLKGRSFVLLGVNSDADRQRLQMRIAEEGISWRSWWDGGGTTGPIASGWTNFKWPTLHLIDAKGILRQLDVSENGVALETRIEALLREADPAVDLP